MHLSALPRAGCSKVGRGRRRSQASAEEAMGVVRRGYSTRGSKEDGTSVPAALQTTTPLGSGEPPGPLSRPVISASLIPFCFPSLLNNDIVPAPPPAENRLKGAIADFYASGRAGDIEVPPEDTSRAEKLWKAGKALLTFYWGGLKLLWRNREDARVLKSQRDMQGWTLTRREIRFIERTEGDLYRLIPFVAIIAILEELLPILVLYAPWLLPSTSVLPSQHHRLKWEEEQRRKSALIALGRWRSIVLPDPGVDAPRGRVILNRNRGVRAVEDEETNALCKSLDLGNKSPWWWLRWRLSSRLQWLKEDDELLRKEGNGVDMTVEEKRMALSQRGILSFSTPASSLQSSLDAWLKFSADPADVGAVHAEMLAKMIDEAERAYSGSEAEAKEVEKKENLEEERGAA